MTKIMKHIGVYGKVFTGICCLFSFMLYSQEQAIDSLHKLVNERANDTVKVLLINELSQAYFQIEDLEKSMEYSIKSIALAEELDFKKGKAYALKNLGMADYYQGNFSDVFEHWILSLQNFEMIADTTGIANMSNNLGAVYYSQGSTDKALEYFFKSLRISEKLGDPIRITSALGNIGGVYGQMKDYDKALDYFGQIEKYLKDLDNDQISASYLMGVGEVYSEKGEVLLAIKNYEEALAINKGGDNHAHNLTMLGKEEYKMGNSEKALSYLKEAYDIAHRSNLQLDMVQTLQIIGDIYQSKEPQMAIEAYEEAVFIAKVIETQEELRDIYKGMSLAYMYLNNFERAYEYQNEYLKLKDLIFNLETDDKIRGLQFDFDLKKKEDEIGLLEKEALIQDLTEKRQKYVIYAAIIVLFLIVLITVGLYRSNKFIRKTTAIIEAEKNRSESLLLNILPEGIAKELKEFGKVKAKRFDSATVMFTDFVGFTAYANNLSPEELVNSVDHYFSRFDGIMEKYGIEKIKTIGDAYMCAGGLLESDNKYVIKMIQAAFDIIDVVEEAKGQDENDLSSFDVRIGLNTGPIVAGVVGIKKFAYDIWGDSVNVASRMETTSEAGRINVSETTYELIKDVYDCEYRGEIDVKNRGVMKMYFVNRAKGSDDGVIERIKEGALR